MNLTPAGVASLLGSAFAEEPETAPAVVPGTEVPPGDGAEGGETSQPAEAPETTETPETTTPEAPATGELPAAVLTQVEAWEQAGGALPPALQAIVDKRIGREVGKVKDLETRATAAEAEVTRLTSELATAGESSAPVVAGATDEKSLNALVATSKKFASDARAYLGGYAEADQTARIEAHLAKQGQDEKALRRQLDEVNDWLGQEVPGLRSKAAAYQTQERAAEALAKQHFATLDDPKHADYAAGQRILKLVPELKQRSPEWKLALGVYALGLREFERRLAASNGGGKPAALPGKAPAKPAVAGRPMESPRVNGARAAEEAASERLRERPTAENVEESLRMALR